MAQCHLRAVLGEVSAPASPSVAVPAATGACSGFGSAPCSTCTFLAVTPPYVAPAGTLGSVALIPGEDENGEWGE